MNKLEDVKLTPAAALLSKKREDIMNRYIAEWRITPDPPIYKSPKPEYPVPTWKKDESTNGEIEVTTPTDVDLEVHTWKMRIWYLKRTFGPPVNFLREIYRWRKKTTVISPHQYSLVDNVHSLFAKAVIAALNGGASTPKEPVVTVAAFCKCVIATMRDLIKDFNNVAAGDGDAKEGNKTTTNETSTAVSAASTGEKGEGASGNDSGGKAASGSASASAAKEPKAQARVVYNQSIIFVVPAGDSSLVVENSGLLNNIVCFKCGPPAAPERPFIVRVGFNEIMLEWDNAEFDGIAPKEYKILMRNETRNFSKWTPIPYKGKITSNRFTIRDLPCGVPCQFKVAAFNNGGWSQYSVETIMICPGEDRLPIDRQLRWYRLSQAGVLGILDRLQAWPFHRGEHLEGMRRISSLGQMQRGYKKSVALKVAVAAIHALYTFPNDPQIAPLAFMLMSYSLMGSGLKRVRVYLLQHDVGALCTKYLEMYRLNAAIVNAISYLRDLLPKNTVPLPPALVFKDAKDGSDEEDLGETTDEEEGEKKNEEEKGENGGHSGGPAKSGEGGRGETDSTKAKKSVTLQATSTKK